MRLHVLFILLCIGTASGQERYLDAIFPNVEVQTFTYSDTLQLDTYSPKGDSVEDRPLLLLVHGGGFAGGKRDNPLEKEFSMNMAQRGYMVASLSYRLTRKGKSFSCDCPSTEKIDTFKAATEDILKATKYLVKKSSALKFNKNNIVLIGSSAGAEAVLNTVYMQYHRAFKDLPYGTTSFAAVVSFAGAVLNEEYITEKTAVPALLFHGAKDKLVPFGRDSHHYCDEETVGYLPLHGSEAISEKLKSLNVSFQLYQDPTGNHDWANLGYAYTNEVARFIKTTLLDGKHEQSIVTVTANRKK